MQGSRSFKHAKRPIQKHVHREVMTLTGAQSPVAFMHVTKPGTISGLRWKTSTALISTASAIGNYWWVMVIVPDGEPINIVQQTGALYKPAGDILAWGNGITERHELAEGTGIGGM